MRLQRLLALPVLLLASLLSHAQTYEPGLLVRSTGDTLRGEIENNFWTEPPTFIRFRANAASPSQLFKPRQLRAVSMTGGRYFRYEALPIDHAATTQLAAFTPDNRTDIQTDSLLAEVLLEGPVMLWRVVRPGSTHYLLRRPGQPALDLAERRYLRETSTGGRELANGNNYRSQLTQYFGDCPAAVAAVQGAAFSAADIAAVATAYLQQCRPDLLPGRNWIAATTARRRMALQGGVLAGLRYNYFKAPFAPLPETEACNDCQPRPFVGLYADLFPKSRTTAVYGELSLSRFSNQYWGYFQTVWGTSYFVINYRAWLASARLGLRFFYPLPHEQQWLLSVSYELNKAFQPVVTSSGGNITEVPDDQLRYGSPALLPNLGLGWRSRRLTLSLDGQLYTRGNAESFFGSLVGSNFAARLGVAYRLGRNPDDARPAASSR